MTAAGATPLYIDLSPLQGSFFERGIPRYVSELVRVLVAADAPIVGLGLAPELAAPHESFADLTSHPLCGFTTPERLERLRSEGAFTILLTSPYEGFPVEQVWRPEVVNGPNPITMIVYDTIPLRFPDLYQETPERKRFYDARTRLLRMADRFLVISESAGRELIEDVGVDPTLVRVIGTGVSAHFAPPADQVAAKTAAAELIGSALPFVMCTAGWTPTKNVRRLIEAWGLLDSALRDSHRLVLVGRVPEELRPEWERWLTDAGVTDSVTVTGRISDAVLLTLYQTTTLFVCPSLHEGFGLPLAEAIRCGAPAIGSNVSPIAEQLVDPAAMFEPTDVVAIVGIMASFLTDSNMGLRTGDRQRGENQLHTWQAVAAAVCGAL